MRTFAALILANLLCLSTSAQTSPPSHPSVAAGRTRRQPEVIPVELNRIKVLSASTGWGASAAGLFVTTDAAAHWKDISPPNPANQRYMDIQVLDLNTAWVLFADQNNNDNSDEAPSSEYDWSFRLASTIDGGTTWTNLDVPLPSGLLAVGGSASFVFQDRLNGWLLVNLQTGSAFSFGVLLQTEDGGRSWRSSEGAPGFFGELNVSPRGDLWAVGGASGRDEIAVSRDRGRTFQAVDLSPPPGVSPKDQATYSPPSFPDRDHGYEVVTYPSSSSDWDLRDAVLFATTNGASWHAVSTLSGLPDDGSQLSSEVPDSTWLISEQIGERQTLLKLHEGDKGSAPSHKNQDFARCSLSFLTAAAGWMNCPSGLYSTSDGGSTWANISPRMKNGVLTAEPLPDSRGVGFSQISANSPLPPSHTK